jgi:hypothetical protein
MATVTPIYNWPVPTSTDYVKDGATAIESLGDAIDSTLNSVTAGRNVGLVHIATATGTNVSFLEAQSIFTSSFNNYRIEFWGNAGSAGDYQLNLQLMNGATPVTSGYVYGMFYLNTSGASGNFGATASASSYAFGQYGTSSYHSSASIDIFNPFQTRMTSFNGMSANTYGSSASAFIYSGAYHTGATAYNGIRINGNTSNLTGELRIYGYRNS